MTDMIIVVSGWLHVLAAVIWIGGIASILFAVLPSSRKVLGGETPKLMAEVSRRFTPVANASIGFLALTGLILAFLGQQPNLWSWPFGLKLLLVMAMFLVHFYRSLLLGPKISRTASETSTASLQKLSLNLVKLNFGIAMVVLFLSAIVA